MRKKRYKNTYMYVCVYIRWSLFLFIQEPLPWSSSSYGMWTYDIRKDIYVKKKKQILKK